MLNFKKVCYKIAASALYQSLMVCFGQNLYTIRTYYYHIKLTLFFVIDFISLFSGNEYIIFINHICKLLLLPRVILYGKTC
jgi:hypothetical protein